MTPHSLPALASIRPRITSSKLSLQVWFRVDLIERLFNPTRRANLQTSSTSQNSSLISLSNLITDRERRNRWSSPFLRLTSVGYARAIKDLWLMYILSVKMLIDVVSRLELVESWTEDELVTVLHEAAHDLGVVRKTFMTVLRHALSGMKVCGVVPRSLPNTYRPDRLDPWWRR